MAQDDTAKLKSRLGRAEQSSERGRDLVLVFLVVSAALVPVAGHEDDRGPGHSVLGLLRAYWFHDVDGGASVWFARVSVVIVVAGLVGLLVWGHVPVRGEDSRTQRQRLLVSMTLVAVAGAVLLVVVGWVTPSHFDLRRGWLVLPAALAWASHIVDDL